MILMDLVYNSYIIIYIIYSITNSYDKITVLWIGGCIKVYIIILYNIGR